MQVNTGVRIRVGYETKIYNNTSVLYLKIQNDSNVGVSYWQLMFLKSLLIEAFVDKVFVSSPNKNNALS